MKRLFLLGLICYSCLAEDLHTEIIIRVKEAKTSCVGFEGQTECYLVQQGSNIDGDSWEYFYDQIEGFHYEPGFVYKLLVAKESVKNPPQDASNIKYILVKELSKEVN